MNGMTPQTTETILPKLNSPDGNGGFNDLGTCVRQAIGAASVCWDPMDGSGVFMDARANQIVDELLATIEGYAAEPVRANTDNHRERFYFAACGGAWVQIKLGDQDRDDTSKAPGVMVGLPCPLCHGAHDLVEITPAAKARLDEIEQQIEERES